MVDSIVQVLMERDGYTREEAETEVEYAREELQRRLENGEDPSDICEQYFSLEPDYLEELL